MKKISIILGLAAVALGFTSCKQEENPKYHQPTDFIISTPAMQNIAFETESEMTSNETFNLFCSQPDYGYAAICNYSAVVSLDPECPVERVVDEETGAVTIQAVEGKSVLLDNQNPTSAAMAIKTYDLGIAMLNLGGIYNDRDDYNASDFAKGTVKAYFRAVCQIDGIDNSAIASTNVVSYNAVKVAYAEKVAGWIYICGNVQNPDTGVVDDFKGPSVANYDWYYNNFRLIEPESMIGQKLYVGQFNIAPKSPTPDLGNVDDTSQFRFFTELLGWTNTASLGSAEADFYVLPISDKFAAGFDGDIVNQGLGNWGVWVSDYTPMTVVVDVPSLKIYIKEGFHEVSFVGRNPEFN
ncbi:MAG: hypothetical protein HDS12_05695 [Bacteroides sp.]|nr:hypothetical protein [Bacteroides sp.]